jgi:hypothetical protein
LLWLLFAPLQRAAANPEECKLQQRDFHECLHKRDQKFRIAKAMVHITEQAEAKKAGKGAAAAPGGH